MTEEIIIDGVNVAECFYFIDHTPPKGQGDWCGAIHKGACKVYSKDCEYNKDCYYKQLKRLEQENKELKEENALLKEQLLKKSETEQAFQSLLDENKELRRKFKQVFNIDNQECWNIAFLNDEKYKYRSALEEIREMCKFNFVAANPIIDKINEVLNESK